jgi:predicted dehydrogenase
LGKAPKIVRAAVIGSGSAGTRLSHVIRELGHHVQVFSRRYDGEEIKNRMTQAGWNDFSHLIIATETASHQQIFDQVAKTGFTGDCLVEKPGLVRLNDFNFSLSHRSKVAFNLRYLPGILRLQEIIHTSTPLSASSVCRSYLPGWRSQSLIMNPHQYSRFKDKGGGVIYDLSHELDYCLFFFGEPQIVRGLGGRFGSVTVDSDDTWNLIIKFLDGPLVSLDLSYLSRLPERTVCIQFEDRTVHLDLITGLLTDSMSQKEQTGSIDQSYEYMLKDWIKIGAPKLPTVGDNQKLLDLSASILRDQFIGI